MSEKADHLDIEEAAVKAALKRRTKEFQALAVRAADPRPWIEEWPWTACAGAAGLGLAAGWLLAAPRQPKPAAPLQEEDRHDPNHRSMTAMLVAGLVPAMQPLLKELADNALGGLGLGGRHADADLHQAAEVPTPETMSPGIAEDNQVV